MKRTAGGYTTVRTADSADERHLNEFIASRDYYEGNQELREVIDMIATGYFSPDEADRFSLQVSLNRRTVGAAE